MRKRTVTKQLLAAALTVSMLAAVTGCGADGADTAVTEENNSAVSEEQSAAGSKEQAPDMGELATITLYPKDAMLQSGVVGGYKADVFKKYANVEVDVWAFSDEKTNAMLSSDSLADVMYVTKDNLEVMIESGMVLNLDEHLDALPNLTDSDLLASALNYMREFNSAGTGELYAIPTSVGTKAIEKYTNLKTMIVLNWEYYKGIGAPEIKDQWALIDVVKKMQEAYPTAEDGIANWGTYLNAGSDTTYWGNMAQYFKWFGYDPVHLPYLLETDMVNGKYASILEDSSKYKEGLQWYNKMYREGLMDPDSINSDRATQKAKVDNGYAMLPSGTVQGYVGYQPIYIDGQQIYQESWTSIYGGDFVLVVNAKSDNIDAALRFVNMMADMDAYMEMFCGPEGDLWALDGNVATVREDVIDTVIAENIENCVLKTGEKTSLWNTFWVFDDNLYTSYVDENGEPRKPRFDYWEEVKNVKANSQQQQEWRELTGYDFFVDQVMAENSYFLESDLDYVNNFASIPDDMMQLTVDAIKTFVVEYSWKMVYAESDEKFEALWDEMVAECEGLGAQDIIDWRLADLENAKTVRDSLRN